MRREEQIVHPDKGPLALGFLLGAVRARPRDLSHHGPITAKCRIYRPLRGWEYSTISGGDATTRAMLRLAVFDGDRPVPSQLADHVP